MVHLPQVDIDLREELGIPSDATVFGRYGGYDTFNLQFVHETIAKVIRDRSDIFPVYEYARVPFRAK
jgi:hypothetical protein